MGIMDTLKSHAKAQFLDVIQWPDQDKETLVYRFPVMGQAIQDGGKLVVREGQAAVFLQEGQMSDVFGPGSYDLNTKTKAISGFFETIKYGLNYPYKGDILFVSTKQNTARKWGTPNPIMMKDAQLGPVRVRAFGVYAFRVTDPGRFVKEIVGSAGLFTADEIDQHVKRKLVSAFADTLGEAKIPVLDLAAQYMDIGDTLRDRMTGWFQSNYGLTLTDFVVENVSLPPEVEKMLDKRTSMGLVGDMGAFTQFQAANAMEQAAGRPGGGGGMMDAGMGLAMGGMMGQQMMRSTQQGGVYNPNQGMPGTPPPPPPSGPAKLHYNGPSGQGEYTAQQIAGLVAANRGADHMVWGAGWPSWKSWKDAPEVAALVPPDGATFTYNGPEGQAELAAAAIAAKVRGNPSGRHLVWRHGMSEWKSAAEVPEIAAAMTAGGPPPLPTGGPPPLPK